MQLTARTFFISGGASGLGAACVRRFAAAGANVVVADVQRDAGERLVAELAERAVFAETNVSDEACVLAALAVAQQRFGPLHGVINCAGVLAAARVVGRSGPHDLALFRRVVEVNLIGTFNVCRLAAAAMCDRVEAGDDERGVIVNTSSVAAFEGQIGQAAYAASKGGVASLTLPLARELARCRIRVVAVAPGIFETPMMAAAPEPVRQSLLAQTVFPPRLGQPDEFAAFVQHIVENPMLNGSVLRLDGAVRMAAK